MRRLVVLGLLIAGCAPFPENEGPQEHYFPRARDGWNIQTMGFAALSDGRLIVTNHLRPRG